RSSNLYLCSCYVSFFFHDRPLTAISTLSLHDALPILIRDFEPRAEVAREVAEAERRRHHDGGPGLRSENAANLIPDRHVVCPNADRKSTRLNSSHVKISYAVFCLKKKNHKIQTSHFGP